MKHQAPPQSYQRFRYVINSRFQLRFIVFMDFVAFLVIGFFYGANLFFFENLKQNAIENGLNSDSLLMHFLLAQEAHLSRIFAATSFIVLGTLTLLGVFYSHRIAGPLYRLTQHFDAITAGAQPGPVSFRSGDFFQEIPEAYNIHLEHLLKHPESSTLDQNSLKSQLNEVRLVR